MFKYIVVGAGLSGAVVAERIASQLNEKVLVVDRKPHIAGTCFDSKDENGILVHRYGDICSAQKTKWFGRIFHSSLIGTTTSTGFSLG